MKRFLINKNIALFVIGVLSSCTQVEDNEVIMETIPNVSTNQVYIDSKKDKLDINDAQKVAALFNSSIKNEKESTRSLNEQDIIINTISDTATGQPLLYVANYGSDNGFAIISGTKKTQPIFAYSQQGHITEYNKDNTLSLFIEAYKNEVLNAINSNPESQEKEHSIEWAIFERNLSETSEKTRSASDAEQLKQQEIQKMTAQGYTYVGDITTLQYYVSQSYYQQVLQNVANNAHPDYDYQSSTLFFIRYDEPYHIMPLINVQWHQYSPFNEDTPNYLAGCVPVAVAQIMYYHKYPNIFNWSQIPSNPTTENTSFITFIKDVRQKCAVTYLKDETKSDISKAKTAFESYGYSVTRYNSLNKTTMANSIINSKPIFLCGTNSNGKGHAWVCEGYKKTEYNAVLSMIPNKPLVRYTESPVDISARPNETFYMAFGQFLGKTNGWYSYNGSNYTSNQQCLIISKN